MKASPDLWAIVLAGGDGRRLSSLTRALYGAEVPKQFAVLEGSRSLLQSTMDRIAPLVPPERTVVVVSEPYESLARAQLAGAPGVDIAVQPRNLDTGPGILFPLARIRARSPDAQAVVFPADHHVKSPARLLDAIASAAAWRGPDARRLVLLGVVPAHAETEYGWIVPGRRLVPRVSAVARFVEKPTAPEAARLFARGAMWNTFISTAPVATYWELARLCLPEQLRLFEGYGPWVDRAGEREALALAYATMPAASFSRNALARATSLAVMRVAGLGWSDWGSPRRVFASLEGTSALDALVQRISSATA
jgi:mannose-1-phosphate guanylyltransferase